MHKTENSLFTNMCLIRRGNEILVQERTKSDWPGITFPGGHVEPGESFDDAVKREVLEETGLILHSAKLCAVEEYKSVHGEDRHVILLYCSEDFEGEIKEKENEDRIYWLKESELFEHPLSDDLDVMYKAIVDESISELVYYYDKNGNYCKKFV